MLFNALCESMRLNVELLVVDLQVHTWSQENMIESKQESIGDGEKQGIQGKTDAIFLCANNIMLLLTSTQAGCFLLLFVSSVF